MTWLYIVTGIVAAIVIALTTATRKQWQASIEQMAKQFGLEYIAGDSFLGPRANGSIKKRSVIIERYKGSSKNATWCTRIRVETDFPHELQLSQETLAATLGKAFLGKDCETGDPQFDGKVLVRGVDATIVLACLTKAARAAVVSGVESGIEFKEAFATVVKRGRIKNPETAQAMLDQALSAGLASRAKGGSTASRLAFNAVHDGVPWVRLKNFERLLDKFPREKAADRCARKLAESNDLRLRAMACEVLPDSVALPSLVGALSQALPYNGLVDEPANIARQLARRFPEAPVVREITPWLLAQLSGHTTVVVAAAEALGGYADVSVIEPMQEAARGGAKKVIREAIVKIQGRATGGLGQLSVALAETGVGALSVAKAQGTTSVAEDETQR